MSHSDEYRDSSTESCSRRGFLEQSLVASAVATLTTPSPSVAVEELGSVRVSLLINNRKHELEIDPRETLLDVLRERLDLTGTKKGCDHGQCGACTVLVDKRRIYSCLNFAIMHAGAEITTIEGLGTNERLHPLQQAFIERDAFQCGYCTSGQICSGVGLMHENKAHTETEIRELMSGNICRCGAYPNIVKAIRDAQAAQAKNP